MSEVLSNPYENPYEYQQQELLDELLQPQPTVIALEGGPCGGKSSLLAHLEQESEQHKRPLVVLPEIATQHISLLQQEGISIPELAQHNRPLYLDFQQNILKDIVEVIDAMKDMYAQTNAIIVTDRCDIGSYITTSERSAIYSSLGLQGAPYLTHVDQLYYLPSIARTAPERYASLQATNGARYEDTAEAAQTCNANLAAVGDHPEFHIVWGEDLDETIRSATQAILSPETEQEVKMAVEDNVARSLIDASIREGSFITQHDIRQSYHQLGGQEFRLRMQQSQPGYTHFFLTIKTGSGITRQEIQRKLTGKQYDMLYAAPRLGNALEKTRYAFLGDRNSSTKKRFWVADQYKNFLEPKWHFETDVLHEDEVPEVYATYSDIMQPTREKAADLIYKYSV